MIQSMTGYGKVEKHTDEGVLSAEIRAVNNRFLEVSVKLPQFLETYEDELKKFVGRHLVRGRITVCITLNGADKELDHLKLNLPLVKKYYEIFSDAVKSLGLNDAVTLQHLLSVPDLISLEIEKVNPVKILDSVKSVLSETMDEVKSMRCSEGEYLSNEFSNHLFAIEGCLDNIEKITKESHNSLLERHHSSLKSLFEELDFDTNRILQEAAILAKRSDITEECERFHSHIKQFRSYMESEAPAGKKMTFLIQEMNREVTTMGAKAENAEVSHLVVDIKAELEKIREQAQNIL